MYEMTYDISTQHLGNSKGAIAVSFRTSIYVGDTYYTAEELEDMIAHMGREYLGRRYHLLQTNCNSFTSDACFALCGERPPGWINRLAGVAMAVHCLCPTSWVPPLQPPSMVPNFDGVAQLSPNLNLQDPAACCCAFADNLAALHHPCVQLQRDHHSTLTSLNPGNHAR